MRFGDVVKYNGRDYVYLAQTTEIIHLGIIPNEEDSQLAINLRNKVFTTGGQNMKRRQDNLIMCFIILTTEELKNRAAYYIKTGQNFRSEDFFDITKYVLNDKDKSDLKKEIIEDNNASKDLKELIKDLKI